MLNENPLNENLLNGELDGSWVNAEDPIAFNDFGLSNEKIVTSRDNESSPAQRELTLVPIPGDDGETIEFERLRRKIIPLTGTVFGNTKEELYDTISQMKKALIRKNGLLKITPIGGGPRYYTATLLSPELLFRNRTGQDITRAPFDIRFLAVKPPVGREAHREVITHFSETIGSFSFEIFNGGEYKTAPQQIISFDAANAVTKINITNNTTGEEIEIEWAFTTGDVVEIDAENKIVKINGIERDFAGFFWLLEAGANSITISITSTSHNYTYTGKFYKRYL